MFVSEFRGVLSQLGEDIIQFTTKIHDGGSTSQLSGKLEIARLPNRSFHLLAPVMEGTDALPNSHQAHAQHPRANGLVATFHMLSRH